jgi:hypothetical protein
MANLSIYPGALDGYSQLPSVIDTVTAIDAITVNRLRDAILNIEKELGVLPSGLGNIDLVSRLNALDLEITSLEANINSLISDLAITDLNVAALTSDLATTDLNVSTLTSDLATTDSNVSNLTITVNGLVTDTETLAYKNPIRLATTGNVGLSGSAPDTIDGVPGVVGDRILVHKQTAASENGIYNIQTLGTGSNGTWVRTDDADTSDKLTTGTEIYVSEGTQAANKFWLTTIEPIVLDTTSLEFVGGLEIMASDSAPTTILTATAIGASEAAATATDSMSIRGFKDIDFSFTVTNMASITEIRVRILYSLLESPDAYGTTPSHWNIVLAENLTSGLSTADPYTISLDASAYPDFAVLPGAFGLRSDSSGLHMMALIWSEVGSPVGSSFTCLGLRKI